MKAKALVTFSPGSGFNLQDIELDALRPEECLVQMVATGICHTDLKSQAGESLVKFPCVLGHEGYPIDVTLKTGAGIVKEVGSAVNNVKIGDKVLLSFNSCGKCRFCQKGAPAYCKHCLALNFGGKRLDGTHTATIDGKPLNANFFGQSSFCYLSVVSSRSVITLADALMKIVKVGSDAPLEKLAPLGCGLQTGAGTVINLLKVRPGSSVAVAGVGAVGLAAIMAAKISNTGTVIAIDLHQSRLSLASDLGATNEILSVGKDINDEIRKVVEDGVDYAIDCTGVPKVVESLVSALGPKGQAVTIGSPGQGQTVSINIFDHLVNGRSYMGTHQGDSNPSQVRPVFA
jgi:Zn-dependent alcohol dehydrogenase